MSARRTGQFARRKGIREELLVRDVVREVDPHASRVPLSGAGGGKFAGDVQFSPAEGVNWVIECKVRKSGFSRLYDWIGSNEILTVRSNGKPRLWVVPEDVMIELLTSYSELHKEDKENEG